jgi:predicted site-specific integrase-resolvase
MSEQATETETLLTPEDLALRWKMKPKTILNWCYAGKLPFAIHIGNQWRFDLIDVEKHEKARRVGKS